ncbi:MAG: hypothetical protein OXU44_03550 [Gammaproteobacteria bacterium]|nr:hypothetical protein [Gammaproteobacteria bacterium]
MKAVEQDPYEALYKEERRLFILCVVVCLVTMIAACTTIVINMSIAIDKANARAAETCILQCSAKGDTTIR